jgi:hypothetical protein
MFRAIIVFVALGVLPPAVGAQETEALKPVVEAVLGDLPDGARLYVVTERGTPGQIGKVATRIGTPEHADLRQALAGLERVQVCEAPCDQGGPENGWARLSELQRGGTSAQVDVEVYIPGSPTRGSFNLVRYTLERHRGAWTIVGEELVYGSLLRRPPGR